MNPTYLATARLLIEVAPDEHVDGIHAGISNGRDAARARTLIRRV